VHLFEESTIISGRSYECRSLLHVEVGAIFFKKKKKRVFVCYSWILMVAGAAAQWWA